MLIVFRLSIWFDHRYAAVYLTAGLENLLEEMVLQCLPAEEEQMLTAALLEHAIANNADLWGLLQPYAHLNAGRTATGGLLHGGIATAGWVTGRITTGGLLAALLVVDYWPHCYWWVTGRTATGGLTPRELVPLMRQCIDFFKHNSWLRLNHKSKYDSCLIIQIAYIC